MTTTTLSRPTRRSPRRARLAAAGVVLAIAAAGTAQAAEPATITLLGASPSYGSLVEVTKANGTKAKVRPSRYNYTIASAANSTLGVPTSASGFCVDTAHYIVSGRAYPVNLMTAADDPAMGTTSYREAGWLVAQSATMIPLAADAPLEAAAFQIAIWQLTGQITGDVPTSDARINTRAAELRALAMGKQLPTTLDVSLPSTPGCIDGSSTVTVTGTPGEIVNLAASPASATVTPAQVTIDETGTATAVLANPAGGQTSVEATASAPLAIRATKPVGLLNPQDQLLVAPRVLKDEATQTFESCGGVFLMPEPSQAGPTLDPTPAAPVAAPAPAAPVEAAPAAPLTPVPATEALSVPEAAAAPMAVAAPAAAMPGGEATYRIRVTNRTGKDARAVTVRQRLQTGLAGLSATGTASARASVSGTAITWTIPRLKAGQGVTLTATVSVDAALAGNLGRAEVDVRGLGRRAQVDSSTPVMRPVGPVDQGF